MQISVMVLSFNNIEVVKPAQALKHVLLVEQNSRSVVCYNVQVQSVAGWHLVGVLYHLP
jgi:hypothetical protein